MGNTVPGGLQSALLYSVIPYGEYPAPDRSANSDNCVWSRYGDAAGKPGGKQRKQTS